MFDAGENNHSTGLTDLASGNYQCSASILLVEDDETLNHQLTILLENQHYHVTSLACGAQALEALKASTFDLIVLDINLPNVDGFGLLNYIRSFSNTPTIMLTAYGAEEHRIKGLRYGADDYISKPCNFEEVSLRIDAVLRRSQLQPAPPTTRYFNYQELTLDKQLHQVLIKSREQEQLVTLTPIQFKLLWVLTQNSGNVLTKPYLYQVVLEREFSLYDRSLDMHLSRVRKVLIQHGMDNQRIRTVHGKGYLIK